MFLTNAHLLLKSSTNTCVQFTIGITCYAAMFTLLVIKIRPKTDIWALYLLPIFMIDVCYFFYATNLETKSRKQADMRIMIEPLDYIDTVIDSPIADSIRNPTLSSEINDYRISHELTPDSDDTSTMFSASASQKVDQ